MYCSNNSFVVLLRHDATIVNFFSSLLHLTAFYRFLLHSTSFYRILPINRPFSDITTENHRISIGNASVKRGRKGDNVELVSACTMV